jgi:hypothetical protein
MPERRTATCRCLAAVIATVARVRATEVETWLTAPRAGPARARDVAQQAYGPALAGRAIGDEDHLVAHKEALVRVLLDSDSLRVESGHRSFAWFLVRRQTGQGTERMRVLQLAGRAPVWVYPPRTSSERRAKTGP